MAPRKRPTIVSVEVHEPPKNKRRKQVNPPTVRRTTRAAAALQELLDNAQPGVPAPVDVLAEAVGFVEEPRQATPPRDNADPDEIRSYRSSSPERPAERNSHVNHEWPHSTALPVRSPISFIDPTEYFARFANIFEETLKTVRDATISSGSSCLVNRLTTAKSLPIFSGDPLEWNHFKNAYEISTRLGEYSGKENISRLFNSLKGEARENVSTLLATSQDAESIMRTLELHYGNKKIVAEKIVTELKSLPGLESGKINLTRFAARLKSATSAFKTFKLFGYLHSPELVKCIGDKIPSALKYSYNRYAASVTDDLPELEKLSDYLFYEAELASAAGIFENVIEPSASISARKSAEKKDARTVKLSAVHAITHESGHAVHSDSVNKNETKNYVCVVCTEASHHPSRCPLFVSSTVDARWRIVKKRSLCFNCLRTGHSRKDCNAKKCTKCSKFHHSMLHADKNSTDKASRSGATDQARDKPTQEVHTITDVPNSP